MSSTCVQKRQIQGIRLSAKRGNCPGKDQNKSHLPTQCPSSRLQATQAQLDPIKGFSALLLPGQSRCKPLLVEPLRLTRPCKKGKTARVANSRDCQTSSGHFLSRVSLAPGSSPQNALGSSRAGPLAREDRAPGSCWSLPGHLSHINKVCGLLRGSFLTVNCQKTKDQKGNEMSVLYYFHHRVAAQTWRPFKTT